jgi:hypothetical protein
MIVKKRVKAPVAKEGRSPFWVNASKAPADEKALAIFQPDILIESQYHATYRRRFHLDPERVLMLAVLQDAVVCFQEHVQATCKQKRAMHRDAEDWILNRDRTYPFSFENVCEALGYDADYLRKGLIRWKESAVDSRYGLRSKPRWPAKNAINVPSELAANQAQK